MVFNKGGKLLNIIEEFINEKRQRRGGGQQRNGGGQQQQQIRIDGRFQFQQNELRNLNSELKGLSFVADHISYKPKNTVFCLTGKLIFVFYS